MRAEHPANTILIAKRYGYKGETDRRIVKGPGMMSLATLIGLVAACLTTTAYAPQAIKTWRTRSTKDVSLGMFALMVTVSRSGLYTA